MSLPGYASSDIRIARNGVINKWRSLGLPTIPSTIDLEMATNPFMFTTHHRRCGILRDQLDMPNNTPAHEVFAEVRRRKDIS
jgi:hydroxyacylglutathione hydrolase